MMKINNYSGSLRIFRARKYIWQFSVYSWNHGKNHSAGKCGGGPDEGQGEVHVEQDADKLDVHDMDEGRTYIIRLINPKIEFKHQFL